MSRLAFSLTRFQFTLPRRERRRRWSNTFKTADFNSRSREGSDLLFLGGTAEGCISIHAPAKGATSSDMLYLPFRRCISIHAPAKGATMPVNPAERGYIYFNSRSREGSDQVTLNGSVVDFISIHAPAKGATVVCKWAGVRARISIHAPAKGATSTVQVNKIKHHNFNSRSREGSDLSIYDLAFWPRISIHAPAKGATCCQIVHLHRSNISIHAPAKGATPCRYFWDRLLDNFNSRSREGSDSRISSLMLTIKYFNSRSREGSDVLCAEGDDMNGDISIHAPAKGATIWHVGVRQAWYDFNSRSREGSDFVFSCPNTLSHIFQFTLPRRERRSPILRCEMQTYISIHAPAKGATHSAGRCLISRKISIHAPAKGATDTLPFFIAAATFQFTLPRRERHQA